MNVQFADSMTGKQVKIMYTNMYAGKKSTILLQFSLGFHVAEHFSGSHDAGGIVLTDVCLNNIAKLNGVI